MPVKIKPDSHDHWLKLRAEDITSTESPALFGLSPYNTEFELYHTKKDSSLGYFEDNERMKWGRRLEDVIAQGVAEDMGITVRRLKTYMRHSKTERMGSSFDYEIVNHPMGPGIMEIKNVDGLIYRQQWEDDEAPEHIEVQVQHQMEVANRNWCLIVALVGGNEPKIIERHRDKAVGKALCDAVDSFWKQADADIEPTPDFERDAEFIAKLYNISTDEILDAREDKELNNLIKEYQFVAREEKSYGVLKAAKKAEILMKVGNQYNKIIADNGISISVGVTKDTAPTIITDDMIGKEIGGREGYRMFKLHQKKQVNIDEPLPETF